MWVSILCAMLSRLIKVGALELTLPSGEVRLFGEGDPLRVRLASKRAVRSIVVNPEMGLGEAYMDGSLVVEGDDLVAFFKLAIGNVQAGNMPVWQQKMARLRFVLNRFAQRASRLKSRSNVAHHYDITVDLYDLFLSPDRMYTCAYYKNEGMSLDEAQEAKINHIAGKLLLEPELRVLDIGCGWGYMACYLAKNYGVHVTGVTLSKTQLACCEERAAQMGVEDLVAFRLTDYRDVDEQFDRVYSVGMLEHVGQPQYKTYFQKVSDCLKEDGIALIHFIGRTAPSRALSPWFNKYIFPGGNLPTLTEVAQVIEPTALGSTDIEVWRGQYERTLRDWRALFESNVAEVEALFDARFVRMWRYYLVASEISMGGMDQVLFHVQLTKDPLRVPSARDYLYGNEIRAQQAAE